MLLCVLGSLGNLVSVWIFRHRSMRSPINTLLCAISVMDLCLLGLAFPVIAVPAIKHSHAFPIPYFSSPPSPLPALVKERRGVGDWREMLYVSVRFLYPLMLMTQSSSLWTFVLISFERYFAVCKPFKQFERVTNRKVPAPPFGVGPMTARVQIHMSLAGVVTAAVLYNLSRFWEYKSHPDGEGRDQSQSQGDRERGPLVQGGGT